MSRTALPRSTGRVLPLVVAGAALAAASPARAQEISLLAMDDYGGSSTVSASNSGADYVASGYREMVKELGVSIANKPMAPGKTLGIYGFSFGIANTFAFIRTGTIDSVNPTGWDLADPDEDPDPFLFIPWLQMRKGLPFSLEVGANFGWIGMSDTAVFGGYGRWAILEGYRQFPDLTVQVGYSGYVGNDELELGVLDMSATFGYSLPFGPTAGIHQSVFSPYVSVGLNRIHAAPRVDLSHTQLTGRVTEITGFAGDKNAVGEDATVEYDATLAPFTIGGGFRVLSGSFTATFAGTYSPGLIATANVGFGFVY
jgi:hypothetical protein